MSTTAGAARQQIRAARERLIEQGLFGQQASLESLGVRLPIERSWRRSVSLNAPSTESPSHFIDKIDPGDPLLRAAGPILDRWRDSLEGMRVGLFLSDNTGQVIARRVAQASDQHRFDRASAAEGFDFSEAALGTNGLGTPMEDRRPVFVQGAEHFNQSLESLACAGAPIYNPLTGKVLGSVAFAAPALAASPMMLAMAQQAALQIQQRVGEDAHSHEFMAITSYLRGRSAQTPILVLSEESIFASVSGLPCVSPAGHALLWEQLRNVDWKTSSTDIELPDSLQRATAHRLASSESGSVFALEVQAAPPKSHPAPRIPASTDTSALAVCDIEELCRITGVLALTGPGGAGKFHLAQQCLNGRMREMAIETFDASEIHEGDTDWFTRSRGALRNGCSVIVRHLEDLPRSEFNRLKVLAASTGSGEGGPRLILTLDDDAPTSIVSLVSQIARTVDVRPLRARRSVLPHLVESFVHEYPSEQRIVLSSAALQAFLRWDWPGNVAELRALIATLVEAAPGRVVHLHDLPQAMRDGIGRRLSPIEALERDAITSALRESGGNRSDAAAALGIGRTTLYRKMRTHSIGTPDQMRS